MRFFRSTFRLFMVCHGVRWSTFTVSFSLREEAYLLDMVATFSHVTFGGLLVICLSMTYFMPCKLAYLHWLLLLLHLVVVSLYFDRAAYASGEEGQLTVLSYNVLAIN